MIEFIARIDSRQERCTSDPETLGEQLKRKRYACHRCHYGQVGPDGICLQCGAEHDQYGNYKEPEMGMK